MRKHICWKKQMKSALHTDVSEFNPSDHMSMEQLIKVISTEDSRLESADCKQIAKTVESAGVESKFRQDGNRQNFQIGNAESTQGEKNVSLLQELIAFIKIMCSFPENQGQSWKRQVQQSIMRKKNQIWCRENGETYRKKQNLEPEKLGEGTRTKQGLRRKIK